MASVKAKGHLLGITMTVTVTDEEEKLKFLVNGKKSENVEQHFRWALAKRHKMLGTYRPPEYSMLNAYNVLGYHFFDEARVDVEIDGDIGMAPGSPDKIY